MQQQQQLPLFFLLDQPVTLAELRAATLDTGALQTFARACGEDTLAEVMEEAPARATRVLTHHKREGEIFFHPLPHPLSQKIRLFFDKNFSL